MQQVLGMVIEMHVVDDDEASTATAGRTWRARLTLLSTSDGRRRPPEGSLVRYPTAEEVADLHTEARQIPAAQRVPLGVVPVHDTFASVYGHLIERSSKTRTH
jgi:hypothetical protein